MKLQEFSDGFTTLLNSYSTQAQFGEQASQREIVLDEYEKSLFLTEAQEEIAIGLYNGRNPLGESFEQTEELRRYLSNLIVEDEPTPITNSSGNPIGVAGSNSYFFTLPNNPAVWFITYEAVKISSEDACKNGTVIEVVPIKQDEYHRIKKNPFRGANDRRALRLDLADDTVEIVCSYAIDTYYIRYVRKPLPIVLEDLTGMGLSINGQSTASDTDNPCELHEALHHKILERAVALAYQSKAQPTQNNKENR